MLKIVLEMNTLPRVDLTMALPEWLYPCYGSYFLDTKPKRSHQRFKPVKVNGSFL